MKTLILHFCILVLTLVNIQEEASCQALYPAYGGMPTSDDEDDDLGLILTVLLLAKQRTNGYKRLGYNGQCCCDTCSTSNSRKTIPVPYPIPFPTNNAIILKSKLSESDDDTSDECGSCQGSSNETDMHTSSEKRKESSRNTTVKYTPVLSSESVEIVPQ